MWTTKGHQQVWVALFEELHLVGYCNTNEFLERNNNQRLSRRFKNFFAMKILIKTLRGSKIEIEVGQYTSVQQLKEEVAAKEGVEVADLHLFHNDKALLDDEATLSDLNITHHAYVPTFGGLTE
jgi:hypothetical protein